MERKVKVYLYDKLAGVLFQSDEGFVFEYDEQYSGISLALSLPVTGNRFESRELHPFFLSLAPEGWLKKKYSELQKLDEKDPLGILLQNGNDLIGAVRLERYI